MKTQIKATFFALLLLIAIPSIVAAQAENAPAVVKLSGEVLTPLDLTLASLNTFSQVSVIRKDKDGKDHNFSGVLLYDLLKKAGVTVDKALRGKNLTKCLLVEANDGYQVLFALAELDAGFTDRKIMLCTQMDGKILPLADGPFRIIVQDEKVPARCVKQVRALQVKIVK